ncbi:MAG: hypothetical protein U1F54_07180 [Burkholderiales bacterium]
MSLLRTIGAALRRPEALADETRTVLNVGGASKSIPIPPHFKGWDHLLLDIDPRCQPDVLCDARELTKLEPGLFDAVYCSHNLEHYFAHDGRKVLAGFLHILKDDGFAEIRVPDLRCVLTHMVSRGMDIEDVLYDSPAGPMTIKDVLYGWAHQIEVSGVDFYAHKTGFTPKSLRATLEAAGFGEVMVVERPAIFEVAAFAFKTRPSEWHRTSLDFSGRLLGT